MDVAVPCGMRKRKGVFVENWRKVYSDFKKEIAFARFIAEKCRRKLHIREV